MTYNYICVSCNNLFEQEHRMVEEPTISCPECGGQARKAIVNSVAVIFNGTGFYSTAIPRRSGLEDVKE